MRLNACMHAFFLKRNSNKIKIKTNTKIRGEGPNPMYNHTIIPYRGYTQTLSRIYKSTSVVQKK